MPCGEAFTSSRALEKARRGVELDLDYMRNWSLQLDFSIMAQTLTRHLMGPGVFRPALTARRHERRIRLLKFAEDFQRGARPARSTLQCLWVARRAPVADSE